MIDGIKHFSHRLFAALGRVRHDNELDAELASHLEMAIEENVEQGMNREEARRQALVRVGGMTQARERHREARGLPSLESFLQDARYALRGVTKNPGFTAAAALTLALGISVNATMFGVVSGFLLQTPPGRDPERVAVITSVNPSRTFMADANPVSVPNYLAWRDENHVFESVAADQELTANLTEQGQTRSIAAAAVSPNYFSALEVSSQLGRVFRDGDDQPGRDHVVILSHELWDREFGSDPSLIGRTIRLNREDYSVIGVTPASFRMLGFVPQLWMPLVVRAADQTAESRRERSLFLFARMQPGVSLEQVRAEFKTLERSTEQDFPETEKGWRIAVRTLPDFLIYNFHVRTVMAVFMTVVGFVLLIACANVAGLLLARAGARQKELAIRMSLGAGRSRIVRQLLTEGLLIALSGGAIGLLLAYLGIAVIRANMAFNDAVRHVPFSVDRNVLAFAFGVSVLSAVLCSLLPALRASRTDINSHLKNEGRGSSSGLQHTRLRSVLVTSEIAAALFLLIGTVLLLRGLYLVDHQNLGFRTEHLLTAGLTLDNARYKDAAQQTIFAGNLIPRLRQIPGAEAVAISSNLPAAGARSLGFQVEGQPELAADQHPRALQVVVSTDYFGATEIPLLRGRTFTEMDDERAPRVVLVNQAFVRSYFSDRDPLGKRIRLDSSAASTGWSEIVGVVGNVKTYSEDTRVEPMTYEPFLQHPQPGFSLMIRTSSDPASLTPALRNIMKDVDVELPLADVMSMTAVIESQRSGTPLFMKIMSTFALLALILAAIGIYGLVSYSVGQRTHEIAIRMALGAKGSDVRRMVLWQGMKIAVIGSAAGLLPALPLPRVLSAIFDNLETADVGVYVIVAIAILAIAGLATYIPARRASSLDPMGALRSD